MGHGNREGAVYASGSFGQHVLSGSRDGKVRVWESNTGCLLLTVKAAPRSTDAVISSTDGMRLVAGGYNGQIKVWDVLDSAHVAQVK